MNMMKKTMKKLLIGIVFSMILGVVHAAKEFAAEIFAGIAELAGLNRFAQASGSNFFMLAPGVAPDRSPAAVAANSIFLGNL